MGARDPVRRGSTWRPTDRSSVGAVGVSDTWGLAREAGRYCGSERLRDEEPRPGLGGGGPCSVAADFVGVNAVPSQASLGTFPPPPPGPGPPAGLDHDRIHHLVEDRFALFLNVPSRRGWTEAQRAEYRAEKEDAMYDHVLASFGPRAPSPPRQPPLQLDMRPLKQVLESLVENRGGATLAQLERGLTNK